MITEQVLSGGFYESVDHDRPYSAEEVNNLFGAVFTEGIFPLGEGNEFEVAFTAHEEGTVETMVKQGGLRKRNVDVINYGSIRINPGMAYFQYRWMNNIQPVDLDIVMPLVDWENSRVSQIVANCYIGIYIDNTARECRLCYKWRNDDPNFVLLYILKLTFRPPGFTLIESHLERASVPYVESRIGAPGVHLLDTPWAKEGFIHFPLNSINPNVCYDKSYTTTVMPNRVISKPVDIQYRESIMLTEETLNQMTFPDGDRMGGTYITLISITENDTDYADSSNPFKNFIQFFISPDNSIYYRVARDFESTPIGGLLDWGSWASIFEAGYSSTKTKVLYTLAEINDMNLPNGIYPFDLRNAGESIAVDSRTRITTGSIIHMKHNEMSGWPCQLLISYAANPISGVWKRMAIGATWCAWWRTDSREVINSKEVLDDPNLPPGLYEVHIPGYREITGDEETDAHLLLIVGRYTMDGTSYEANYGQQIALPFGYGRARGIHYRIVDGSNWSKWLGAEESAYNDKYIRVVGAPSAGYNPPTKPLYKLTVNDMNNPNFPYPYMTTVQNVESGPLGLVANFWYHLLYFRHWDNNGYGAQLAIPLTNDNAPMAWRNSIGTGWLPWKTVYDSHNAPPAPTDISGHAAKDLALTGGTVSGPFRAGPEIYFNNLPNNPNPSNSWVASGFYGQARVHYTRISDLIQTINGRGEGVTQNNANYTTFMARAIAITPDSLSSMANGAIDMIYG